MGYVDEGYIKPLFKAFKQWKLLLYSMVVDFFLYLFSFGIFYATFSIIGYFMLPLNSHDLSDHITFFRDVSLYTTQIENFILVLYVGSIICLLLFLLIYSISRTMIWNKILKIKGNYFRNLLVDGIIFIILLALSYLVIMYLKPEFINGFIVLIMFPILYYLFFCHINLGHKKIKEVFKSALSLDLLYLFPHLIVMLFILVFILSFLFVTGNPLFLVLLLLWTGFFRIYSKEVVFSLEGR